MWLDPIKTTPFQLYQYLLNTSDSEVEDLLLRLTFLIDIEKTMEDQQQNPGNRSAQKLLASTLVGMIHGDSAL